MTCAACGHDQERGRFCGRCGARVLDAPRPEGTPASPRHRSRSAVGLWLAVLVAAAAALVLPRLMGPEETDEVVAASQGRPDRSAVRLPSTSTPSPPPQPSLPPMPDPPSGRPYFGEPIGTVLLFDDGTTGAVVLDLDTGGAQVLPLPGQRAGDQPYRLWPLGGRVVVGSGEIHAVVPGTALAPRTLGEATVCLPAADPDELWLVDHGSSVEPSVSTWTLIDAAGDVLASTTAVDGYEAIRGVPEGLGLRDPEGALWRYDLRQERILGPLTDTGPAWLGDASEDRMAWCTGDPCSPLVVADAEGYPLATFADGAVDPPEAMWLSPDGSLLAVVVWVAVGDGMDRRLRVLDVAASAVLADDQLPLGDVDGDWGPDGSFFAWVRGLPGTSLSSLLARWDGTDITTVTSGLRVAGGFVALPRVAVAGLLATGAGAGCPASDRSDAMGSLPAWRGDRVHVAFLRHRPTEPPTELLIGVEGSLTSTSMTVAASLLGGDQRASFRVGTPDWHEELTVRGGLRAAEGFPPH